ncbi:unnamed protein product, partial [Mesorhabditis belari]|uniref:Protein-L-isoaspartate O-methyltransferase domain-containing protein 1 n=1 Tax=Mesorhabditis belari TaxID=2138241 RepID=A0AAF3ECY1_9BILA
MGTTASKDNDELVDYLVNDRSLRCKDVERGFRLVDRGRFIPPGAHEDAYRDAPYRDRDTNPVEDAERPPSSIGSIHLSAPCIYTSALDHLQLKRGQTFLNIGSGTGYLNTVVGFIIGSTGTNHGIEYFENLVEYANKKLVETLKGPEINCYDFALPTFLHGNGLLINDESKEFYDRIYIGAAITEEALQNMGNLLKVGGQLVAPVENSMICYRRTATDDFQRENYSNVSFSTLLPISPNTKPVVLPNDSYKNFSLRELCRTAIRQTIMKKAQSLTPVELQQRVDETMEEPQEYDDRPTNSMVLHVTGRGGQPRPVMIGLRREALPHIRRARQALDDVGIHQNEINQEEQQEREQEEDADEANIRIRRARLLRALMLGERDHAMARRARRLREIADERRRFRGELVENFRDEGEPVEEMREGEEAGEGQEEREIEADEHLIFSSETSDEDSEEEEDEQGNESGEQQQPEHDIPLMDGIVEDIVVRPDKNQPNPLRASSSGTSLRQSQPAMQPHIPMEDESEGTTNDENSSKRRRVGSDSEDSTNSTSGEEQRLIVVKRQSESLIQCSNQFIQILDELKLPKNLKVYCRYGVSD